MDRDSSKRRFEEWMASRGVTLGSLTPLDGLDLMLRFFGEAPNDGCLTCTWGVVTQYGEEEFGFEITHRYYPDREGSRATPPDFALVFRIGPRTLVGDLDGGGLNWCVAEDLTDYRPKMEKLPAFRAWGRSSAAEVLLIGERYWPFDDPLFDQWGVRNPERPVLRMTEEEWLTSDDVPLMMSWFCQEWRGEEADLVKLLHGYYLACCRRIWKLLPMEESRRGIEIAERYIEGKATREDLESAEFYAEGAALYLDTDDYSSETEGIAEAVSWCSKEEWSQHVEERKARTEVLAKEVEAIPHDEMRQMVRWAGHDATLSSREILMWAAYFVDIVIMGPAIRARHCGLNGYQQFLPAPLLREMVGNPFRPASERPST